MSRGDEGAGNADWKQEVRSAPDFTSSIRYIGMVRPLAQTVKRPAPSRPVAALKPAGGCSAGPAFGPLILRPRQCRLWPKAALRFSVWARPKTRTVPPAMSPPLNKRRKAFTAVVERYWPVKVVPRNWPSPTPAARPAARGGGGPAR